ncbi:MAG: hypothetical protein V3V04_04715 [Rhizobiaceae bacterium]
MAQKQISPVRLFGFKQAVEFATFFEKLTFTYAPAPPIAILVDTKKQLGLELDYLPLKAAIEEIENAG